MHYMGTLSASKRLLIGALALGSAIPALGQNLQMTIRPAFEGLTPDAGGGAMIVDISNLGRDAKGVLNVAAGAFSRSYPVEIPSGGRTKVITYPEGYEYQIGYYLDTNRGRAQEFGQGYMPYQTGPAPDFISGMVSESRGALDFIRTKDGTLSGNALPVYASPADAPDRSAGYTRLNSLVLGTGSEKLGDSAVKAIQDWTKMGGTLIFVGGESNRVLVDPRWQNVVPVTDIKEKGFTNEPSLQNQYLGRTGSFTAYVGKPVSVADAQNNDLIVERPYGLGRAFYIALDPFTSPMSSWPGRSRLVSDLFGRAVGVSSDFVVSGVLAGERPNIAQAATDQKNPFQANLPSSGTVISILAVYFIAVVPLNFFLLRRAKRGELAWATAPILSLSFAGIFFGAARGLYSAKLSTSTNAIMVVQAGDADATVVGNTQLYFPQSGRYDLKLSRVMSLSIDSNATGGPGDAQGLDSVDQGQIGASLSVPNLAFRQVNFQEEIAAGKWFEIKGSQWPRFTVTNSSPYHLWDARLCAGAGWISLGDLGPNSSKTVSFVGAQSSQDDMPGRFARMLVRSHAIGLTGKIEDLRVGPKVGEEVLGSNGVTLAFISNLVLPQQQVVAPLQQAVAK